MYRIPARNVGSADGIIHTSALPTPEDDAANQYRAMNVGRAVPSILSRHRQEFGDPTVPRSYPNVSLEDAPFLIRDTPSGPYSEATSQGHHHVSPDGSSMAQSASRFYIWRPQKDARQYVVDQQRPSEQRLAASLGMTLGNHATSRARDQIIPQKRRLEVNEPRKYIEESTFRIHGQHRLHSDSRMPAAPQARVASPAMAEHNGPPQLPPAESELLEAVHDHYCEIGDSLSTRVLGQLRGHHDQLRRSLKQIASVDKRFLHRLNVCNDFISRPLAEVVSMRDKDGNGSVLLGEEVARMKKKTAELVDFFERKGREWDAAKAAEDEAWERILHALKSQDSGAGVDGRVEAFVAQVEEEERRAIAAMDEQQKVFKEEADRVIEKNGKELFKF